MVTVTIFLNVQFFGKGETVSFDIQAGSRSQSYQIALTEPWFLDRPITAAGLNVFMAAALERFGEGQIPYYERFFMGGENQIRGYDIRSVGPRNEDGALIGGNKMLLFNAEYSIPLAGPLRAVLFFDAGQAYAEDQPWSFDIFKELRTSTGGELRFFVPVLNMPFRLIFAFNPHRDLYQPATSFRFGIGTTF